VTTAGLLSAGLVAATLFVVHRGRRAVALAHARRGLVAYRPPGTERVVLPAPHRVRAALDELDLGVHHDIVWHAWIAAAAVLPALGLLCAGAGLAVLLLVTVGVAPFLAWRANRGRRDARVEAALPLALEAVARSLRSGAGLRGAVAEAAASAPGVLAVDLARSARAAEAVGVVDALERWGRRRPLPGVRLAVAALCLGAETGGAQARAIDGVAATLRQRLAIAAEARSLASQARASAAVIALAPIGFCGLASTTDQRVGAFLFRSGAGLAVLTAGLLLDAVGALWMARLTRITP
jgi:tight adherence protein B